MRSLSISEPMAKGSSPNEASGLYRKRKTSFGSYNRAALSYDPPQSMMMFT